MVYLLQNRVVLEKLFYNKLQAGNKE